MSIPLRPLVTPHVHGVLSHRRDLDAESYSPADLRRNRPSASPAAPWAGQEEVRDALSGLEEKIVVAEYRVKLPSEAQTKRGLETP